MPACTVQATVPTPCIDRGHRNRRSRQHGCLSGAGTVCGAGCGQGRAHQQCQRFTLHQYTHTAVFPGGSGGATGFADLQDQGRANRIEGQWRLIRQIEPACRCAVFLSNIFNPLEPTRFGRYLCGVGSEFKPRCTQHPFKPRSSKS